MHIQNITHSSGEEQKKTREKRGEEKRKEMFLSWLQHCKRAWQTFLRYPLPISAFLLILLSLCLWLLNQAVVAQGILFVIMLLGGVPLLLETVKQCLYKEFSIDFIALLAISGSLWLGEYLAGAIIVLMLSGGVALEAYALRRARRSLTELAERAPRIAHIWQEESLLDIPAEMIEVGMNVVVKPGELIPVDGIVARGNSSVSEADITGEPVPVSKSPGMSIFSGSVNLDSVLEIQASKRSAESKYAQIVRLVEQAQEQKAPIHRLADRYSLFFTAATLLFAGLAWFFTGESVHALAVLVVATPCPLILATPIAIMSGINVAARQGIIAKSGAAIEQLGEVDVAVFDKTGTLTLGTPSVTTISLLPEQRAQLTRNRMDAENLLLYYAASVEQLSTHILARAVVEAAQKRGLFLKPASDFQEIFGKGVSGLVPGEMAASAETRAVAVGNRTFLHHLDIALPEALLEEREQRTSKGQLCSFVAVDGVCIGLVVMEDIPHPELAQLSPSLKREGIKTTVLLTGDSEAVAQQIGQLAQIDQVVSRCSPDDKVRAVQALTRQNHRVLMVGDGINDAPALATAAIGIAMGTHGLTATANVADAVLLSNDIMRVVNAVSLGRRVVAIARQGIWIGMGLSIIAMGFAAVGL
ncbi:MAG TPA: cation-translocating P-type ATPase, partial [Ktedonobacteraceae bacterium]|nr:cation-translocating P-type ATPase [Ktedonobacteraceae bacterium]